MQNIGKYSKRKLLILPIAAVIVTTVFVIQHAQAAADHQAIAAEAAPAAIGPYSQAIRVGDVVYLAGQIGLDPTSGNLVEGGIEAQTKQALDNLGAVLKEAGMDYDNVVRATVFLSDLSNFQTMNDVYREYFKSDHPPARSTVQVVAIPRGALVEIDFIAVK
jgi:2-iminobutanoate/2-iminopropanoate deaminase